MKLYSAELSPFAARPRVAIYAKNLGYVRKNKVPFDAVVNLMKNTGHDLNKAYKETSLGGLALEFDL